MFTRARGADVSFRVVKIKIPGPGDVNDVMHRKRARRFLGDLKKVRELSSWLGRRKLTFACSPKPGQWPCGGCRTCFGADRKASIERLCLSLLMSKNLLTQR